MRFKYKGYGFKYSIDEENSVLFGEVLGINDVVTFQAETVAGLIREFKLSVDDYLAFCEESEVEPKKPYSGKFVVRISPELHREAATLADSQGGSLNSFISRCVEDHLASVNK